MYLHLFCLHTDLDQCVDFGNVQRFQLFILRDACLLYTSCISNPESKVQVYIVPTNEELVIARDTVRLLGL